MTLNRKTASLCVPADIVHLPTMRSFLEETARAFNFAQGDCFRIGLAGEELFSYVCSLESAGAFVEINLQSVDYQIRATFLFDARQFDPWAFNIGANVSPDDEASLEGLGLLLAARAVDRFSISLRNDGRIELLMVKDKSYPETSASAPSSPFGVSGSWKVRDAQPDDIRLFSGWVGQVCGMQNCPPFLNSAGRLLDMVGSGEYGMVVAVDEKEAVVGAALWHERTDKAFESFGPYIAGEEAAACAGDLVEAVVSRLAKTRAVCLLSRWMTSATPDGSFERLGDIELLDAQGRIHSVPVVYRLLREDAGCRIWTPAELEPFLRAEYDRLYFAREMVIARIEGEQRAMHSVFAARIDRLRRSATLTAVMDGRDAQENLLRQIAACERENMPNIFFELDLATAWQAALAPALINNGFIPKLVMPYAGHADIVLFQKALTA